MVRNSRVRVAGVAPASQREHAERLRMKFALHAEALARAAKSLGVEVVEASAQRRARRAEREPDDA